MAMIKVGSDYFSEDVIAYVRKLKKTKPIELDNGGRIPSKSYVLALKAGYFLDGTLRKVSSIFLNEEEGLSVIEQIEGIHKAGKVKESTP